MQFLAHARAFPGASSHRPHSSSRLRVGHRGGGLNSPRSLGPALGIALGFILKAVLLAVFTACSRALCVSSACGAFGSASPFALVPLGFLQRHDHTSFDLGLSLALPVQLILRPCSCSRTSRFTYGRLRALRQCRLGAPCALATLFPMLPRLSVISAVGRGAPSSWPLARRRCEPFPVARTVRSSDREQRYPPVDCVSRF